MYCSRNASSSCFKAIHCTLFGSCAHKVESPSHKIEQVIHSDPELASSLPRPPVMNPPEGPGIGTRLRHTEQGSIIHPKDGAHHSLVLSSVRHQSRSVVSAVVLTCDKTAYILGELRCCVPWRPSLVSPSPSSWRAGPLNPSRG